MKSFARAILFCLAIFGAASCGSGNGGKTHYFTLMGNGWNPPSDSAEPGDHIIFNNASETVMQVMATSPAKVFPDSGILRKGGSYEWSIPKDVAGLVRFEDDISHLAGSVSIMTPK